MFIIVYKNKVAYYNIIMEDPSKDPNNENFAVVLERSMREIYADLRKRFVNFNDPTTKVLILAYCKGLSDKAMKDYKENKNLASGIRVIALTDICEHICGHKKSRR